MIQKKYFDYQKKINSNLFTDYNLITLNISQKFLLDINKCVVNLFNYSEDKHFKNLHQVQKFLNKTKFYSLKKNLNLMTKLEKVVYNYLLKIKIINKHIKGIQFPIDIRIAHPNKPKQLKKKKYLTSTIHCDTWTEEPTDIINGILYLVVNKNTPKISILQSDKHDISKYRKYAHTYKNQFFLNSKKYFSIVKELESKKSCQFKHKNGQLMIFNGFVPHQTIVEGNEVRLSLEFRLRTKNPYKEINKWRNYNNHGRYWFLPSGNEDNFFQRLKTEYSKIKKLQNFKKIIDLRNNEIVKKLILQTSKT
jgi:hypothetical protein